MRIERKVFQGEALDEYLVKMSGQWFVTKARNAAEALEKALEFLEIQQIRYGVQRN